MDMIDLSTTVIHSSPHDVASWPVTIEIPALSMRRAGGLALTFSPPPPDAWKWFGIGEGGDNVQFTVWAVVQVAGVWHAAAFVQMWQFRPMGDGALPPILSEFVNWWGDVRHLWGVMSDYVPRAGDVVGFFVSAGNARLFDGVTSVRERSDVVSVTLPAGDTGDFTFGDDPPPPPAPPIAHGYDEGEINGFIVDERIAYANASHAIDPFFAVWTARMQFDAITIGYTASRAKHLAELRAALGLPA